MGAWGTLAFDNDDANDWAYALVDSDDLSLVDTAFAEVEGAGDYLEAPQACVALAACEVLARLKGRPGYQNAYTKQVDDWVTQHPIDPPAELLARADSAIDRILADGSELRDLWGEGYADERLAAVEDLRGRVQA